MIGTIARKEILANLLGYKFYVVVLLAAVLAGTSLFIMTRDYKGRLDDYGLIRPKPGEPIAVNPPNPLAIFAKGLDESMARSFEVGTTGITVRAGQKSANAVFAFFPTPDFLYIVRVVLSLESDTNESNRRHDISKGYWNRASPRAAVRMGNGDTLS
jgi:hypothetical protein